MEPPGAMAASPGSHAREAAPSAGWLATLLRVFLQEDVNFLVTNRIPRRWATQFMGWFSRIEVGWIKDASIAVWRRFAPDLDLSEARQREFRSLHDCFIRELRDGARPTDRDPAIVASPCDAIVGACGPIDGIEVIQAKGFPYRLDELLPDRARVERHRGGRFVTLRLKSSMYHRFHAPCDATVRRVTYVSGDTWNVNPIALRRVEKLFCKNERAVLELALDDDARALTLVAVAAILVASIRLRFLDRPLDRTWRGPDAIECDARFRKGDELGWFQHGSTMLVFASKGFELCESVVDGATVRVGQPLLRMVDGAPSPPSASASRRSS
jgi:phosphatidylserine decarboxylase